MTLGQKLSKKELDVLLNYKPENVDVDLIEEEIDRLGYSKLLSLWGTIVDNDLYNEVQSKEVISWLMEYVSWHIKTKLFA